MRRRLRRLHAGRRWAGWTLGLIALALVASGFAGAERYVRGYWIYRGYAPPRLPGHVIVRSARGRLRVPVRSGSLVTLSMRTPALPGRTQQVLVLLPAGYHAHPRRRYPVLYLLHGAPLGSPQDFLNVDRLQVVASVLRARRRMRPLILVMPEGAPRFFWTGWVNATGRSGHWERYVARDVVHTVDSRFRTIAGSAGRGIGGLSAGAYGALDIALHHPREFGLIESWSGYMHADDSAKVLGGQAMIARDSPAWLVAREAPLLRRLGTYIWFYVGAGDHYAPQNRAFAAELRRLGIPHRFFVRRGGHSWALWRRQTPAALTAASARLAHG